MFLYFRTSHEYYGVMKHCVCNSFSRFRNASKWGVFVKGLWELCVLFLQLLSKFEIILKVKSRGFLPQKLLCALNFFVNKVLLVNRYLLLLHSAVPYDFSLWENLCVYKSWEESIVTAWAHLSSFSPIISSWPILFPFYPPGLPTIHSPVSFWAVPGIVAGHP